MGSKYFDEEKVFKFGAARITDDAVATVGIVQEVAALVERLEKLEARLDALDARTGE